MFARYPNRLFSITCLASQLSLHSQGGLVKEGDEEKTIRSTTVTI
jgi:hypothetical protein